MASLQNIVIRLALIPIPSENVKALEVFNESLLLLGKLEQKEHVIVATEKIVQAMALAVTFAAEDAEVR